MKRSTGIHMRLFGTSMTQTSQEFYQFANIIIFIYIYKQCCRIGCQR
jgi:hypothetical protein